MKRRNFIQKAGLSAASIAATPLLAKESDKKPLQKTFSTKNIPIAICTWNCPNATAKAWEVLNEGGSALDAVEQGVMIEEADLENQSVGNGGRPDRDGNVTLDACIMDHTGNAGSVVYLQNIEHPVSVARKVMEDTPHVILAGKGAEQFAYEKGFKKVDLLSEKSKKEWEEWKVNSEYKPIINIENHDTIGMLAIDKEGRISGACTTSGMAYKMAGRVGDSPIIGSGLFIDDEVGGATATGMGELVLKTVGSFLIVELMRQGYSPQEACEEGIRRIVAKNNNYKEFQIGYLAMNKAGEVGCYCLHKGFSYSKYTKEGQIEIASDSYLNS